MARPGTGRAGAASLARSQASTPAGSSPTSGDCQARAVAEYPAAQKERLAITAVYSTPVRRAILASQSHTELGVSLRPEFPYHQHGKVEGRQRQQISPISRSHRANPPTTHSHREIIPGPQSSNDSRACSTYWPLHADTHHRARLPPRTHSRRSTTLSMHSAGPHARHSRNRIDLYHRVETPHPHRLPPPLALGPRPTQRHRTPRAGVSDPPLIRNLPARSTAQSTSLQN